MLSTNLLQACCAPCTNVSLFFIANTNSYLAIVPLNQVFFTIGTSDPDGLILLRQRYNAQHYALIKFYFECSNLKYLTSLISVPKLPQDPPNLFGTDSPLLMPRQAATPKLPPRESPPPSPGVDWAEQQREIAKKQREYDLEQQRLQQQRELEQQQQQMEALRLQQEFDEQKRLQLERERLQREQLGREQMQRQAEGRLAELERDVLALRGQYERDQMLIDQYDRVSAWFLGQSNDVTGPGLGGSDILT